MPEPSKADIDRLVYERHPQLRLVEIAAATSASLYRGHPDKTPDFSADLAKLNAARGEFLALPRQELLALIAASRAREAEAQRKRDDARQAVKDAARFFNQPAAMARFEVWCRAGFWTTDEAAALLLGRDPHTVNPDSLARELGQSTGLLGLGDRPQRTEFHRRFDDLRLMLGRADGLSRPEMKPVQVAAWAERTRAVELPAEIAALAALPTQTPVLESSVAETRPTETVQASQTQHIKRSALVRRYEAEWRTIESDLRHADENGLAAVAKGARHGMWDEQAALHWARQNGKTRHEPDPLASAHAPWPGRVHRIES